MAITLQEDWSGYPENTELKNISGWTVSAPFAVDEDNVQVNATSQLKHVGGNRVLAYYDAALSDPYIKMTVAAWPNFLGIAVRCIDQLNYIGIRPFGADVQVYHKTGSATYNQIQMISGAGVSVGGVVELTLTGDTLKFFYNGIQYGTDMDVTGIHSGTNVGMYLVAGDPIAGDVEIGGTAAVDSITIDQNPDRIVYPVFGATRSHTISGSFVSATSSPIEYKVENFVGGAVIVDWTVLVASPVGSTYSENVNIPKGKYYKISTRLADNITVEDSSTRIGFGKVIELGGQSNAERLITTTVTTPPIDDICIFDGVSSWDSPTNQTIIDMLNVISVSLGCVVCVYNTAVSGSPISFHLPGGSNYAARQSKLVAAGGKITDFLWIQGESDTSTPQMELYLTNLIALRADILSRASQASSTMPMFISQLGRKEGGTGGIGDLGWDTIREAQTSFSNSSPDVVISHQAMDLTMSDSLHRDEAGRLQDCLRLASSYNNHYGIGENGKGAIPISASVSGADVVISHNLNGSSIINLPANAKDGYELSQDDFSSFLTINNISVTLNEITLTTDSVIVGEVKVRSQKGQDPDNLKMPTCNKVFDGQEVMVEPIILSIASSLLSSTFTLTGTGTPDGTYLTDFYNNETKTLIESKNLSFTNGNASTTLSVPVGNSVLSHTPGNNPMITGVDWLGDTT